MQKGQRFNILLRSVKVTPFWKRGPKATESYNLTPWALKAGLKIARSQKLARLSAEDSIPLLAPLFLLQSRDKTI